MLPRKKKTEKKAKKPNLSTLMKKLDDVFSKYIRLRDAVPHSGVCFCISCGRPHHWTEIQNGHYMSRRYMSTRFMEKNCHPQCVACNIFNQGNIQMYRKALVKKYGENEVNKIEVTARVVTKKYSAYEYEQLIQYYKALVDKLKAEKGL